MSKKLMILCAAFLLLVVIIAVPGYLNIYKDMRAKEIPSNKAFKIYSSNKDTIVLDLQSADAYNKYHVSGSVNISIDNLAEYANNNLTDKTQPIICYCFCGGEGSTALEAYELLNGLGYKKVYHTFPASEWSFDGNDEYEDEHQTISGEEARTMVSSNPSTILLDVRNYDEYERNNIEGSVLIPVSELEIRLSELPDKSTNIIVYCAAGIRSKTAYDILTGNGYTDVYDMQTIDNW